MLARKPNQQQGFTIVEIMIVLAIGGLILLLVFQAIPALQRNARNNQRRQDVSAILEAVSHFSLNNSGRMPDDCGAGGGQDECAAPNRVLSNAHLNYYYDASATGKVSILIKTLTAGDTTVSNPNNIDKVRVYNYQRCNSNNPGEPTPQAAGFRDVVALYAIETRTGTDKQCQQL